MFRLVPLGIKYDRYGQGEERPSCEMSAYRIDKGRLVGGGAYCEGCGSRLKEGATVYAVTMATVRSGAFLCCPACRPSPEELPATVISLESALAVEEPGSHEEGSPYEVKEGSECAVCGHLFLRGEWLLVGVTETLGGNAVYCPECRRALFDEGG